MGAPANTSVIQQVLLVFITVSVIELLCLIHQPDKSAVFAPPPLQFSISLDGRRWNGGVVRVETAEEE